MSIHGPSRSMECLLLALLAMRLLSCGGGTPIPEVEIAQEVHLDVDEVALGAGFTLTLERIWPRDHEPDAWPELGTDSVVLHVLDERRTADDRRIRIVRTYRAHVFVPGTLTIAAGRFRARSVTSDAVIEAHSEPHTLKVVPALAVGDASEVEFPDGPLEEPERAWLVPGVIALGALGLFVHLRRRWRRRIPAMASVVETQPMSTHDVAVVPLAELERLMGTVCADRETCERVYGEAADVLRTYVGERHGVRVRERTSEELVGEVDLIAPASGRAQELRRVLHACDRVKFALQHPSKAERAVFFEHAIEYVRATRPLEDRS